MWQMITKNHFKQTFFFTLILLLSINFTSATLYFQSGFKPPQYSTGNLYGQDTWLNGVNSTRLGVYNLSGNYVIRKPVSSGTTLYWTNSNISTANYTEFRFLFRGDNKAVIEIKSIEVW